MQGQCPSAALLACVDERIEADYIHTLVPEYPLHSITMKLPNVDNNPLYPKEDPLTLTTPFRPFQASQHGTLGDPGTKPVSQHLLQQCACDLPPSRSRTRADASVVSDSTSARVVSRRVHVPKFGSFKDSFKGYYRGSFRGLGYKGPCTQMAQSTNVGTTLRPTYILFGYRDP